jgi:colanic acid/amylovoran biosynthesis glycosyltransferase
MRVLHLWDNYAPGLFDRSFEICRDEGLETRLICMNYVGRGQSRGEGVTAVCELAKEEVATTLVQRLRRRLRTAVDRRRFGALASGVLANFQPDVIHVHYGTTAAALVGELEPYAARTLISFYGFDISQGLRIPSIRAGYERLFRKSPLAHVLCDDARDRVIGLGLSNTRIVDANLPLPVELYPDIGIAPDGPFRWLIPARFVEKKGHAVALRAFRTHLERCPDDRLTCWGYGEPAWLVALVAELGLQDRVDVVHNGDEGPFDAAYLRQLREHDVILAPSVTAARGDDEGGPALTAVLAQVAGKPVIMSDFPGHERSLDDGVEGFVVPQGDVDALALAMTELAADRQRAAAMGQAGRRRALRAFDEAAYRSALLGWYRTLAA